MLHKFERQWLKETVTLLTDAVRLTQADHCLTDVSLQTFSSLTPPPIIDRFLHNTKTFVSFLLQSVLNCVICIHTNEECAWTVAIGHLASHCEL